MRIHTKVNLSTIFFLTSKKQRKYHSKGKQCGESKKPEMVYFIDSKFYRHHTKNEFYFHGKYSLDFHDACIFISQKLYNFGVLL
jgi:hypothetical protein